MLSSLNICCAYFVSISFLFCFFFYFPISYITRSHIIHHSFSFSSYNCCTILLFACFQLIRIKTSFYRVTNTILCSKYTYYLKLTICLLIRYKIKCFIFIANFQFRLHPNRKLKICKLLF